MCEEINETVRNVSEGLFSFMSTSQSKPADWKSFDRSHAAFWVTVKPKPVRRRIGLEETSGEDEERGKGVFLILIEETI